MSRRFQKFPLLIIGVFVVGHYIYDFMVVNQMLVKIDYSQRTYSHVENDEHRYNNSTTATANTKAIILATIPSEGPDMRIRSFLQETIFQPNMKENQSQEFQIQRSDGSACSPTSQVQIIQRTNYSVGGIDKTQIILQSLDEKGNAQTQGGDEFVIIYIDEITIYSQKKIDLNKPYELEPTAYAIASDNLDGTYTVDFVRPPMTEISHLERNETFQPTGHGILFVTLDYTCGHGRMTKPTKDRWRNGGSLWFLDWFVDNITIPTEAIRRYEPTPSLNTEEYDRIICFGDSLIQNSCGVAWERYFFRVSKLETLPKNYGLPLCERNHSSVDHVLDDLVKFIGNSSKFSEEKTVILTGSSAWDAFSNSQNNSNDFNETLENNRYIVTQIQKKYPRATIVWRGPSAVHLGVLGKKCLEYQDKCTERVRYISNSVTQYLNQRQKSLMEELGVYYLDVWEMSYLSGNWHMDGDAQHFRTWLQHLFIDQLYPLKDRFYHILNQTNWIVK